MFCDGLDPRNAIAIDTESDHFMSYRPQTCVIQICVEGEVSFVDALEFDATGMEPLSEICADPRFEKLLHSASNDLREMHRDYNTVYENIFDTQLALQFLGYEKTGLAFLLEEFGGLKISKKYQRYNWRTRPIHPVAIDYAAADVLYLESCRDALVTLLKKSPFYDAFNQQCEMVAAHTRYQEKEFDEEGWRRIKQAKTISDDLTRGTFKQLYIWRHETCQRVDRAALHLFQNDTMKRVAFHRPTTLKALRKIRGVDKMYRRYYRDILNVIEEAEGLELPKSPPRKSHYPKQEDVERFERIRKWRNAKSEEIGLPPGLIANNSLIQALANALPNDVTIFETHYEFLPWKAQFRDEILKLA